MSTMFAQPILIRITAACAYCGKDSQTFFLSSLGRETIPGLAPVFCSENCAANYLAADKELEGLR